MTRRYMLDARKNPRMALNAFTSDVVREVQKKVNYLQGVSEEALALAAAEVLALARVLCPKDTTALVESGYFEITKTPTRLVAEIGFARPSALAKIAGRKPPEGYAAYVHENLEAYHEPPTQAKFLEEAVKQKAGEFIGILERSAKSSV